MYCDAKLELLKHTYNNSYNYSKSCHFYPLGIFISIFTAANRIADTEMYQGIKTVVDERVSNGADERRELLKIFVLFVLPRHSVILYDRILTVSLLSHINLLAEGC